MCLRSPPERQPRRGGRAARLRPVHEPGAGHHGGLQDQGRHRHGGASSCVATLWPCVCHGKAAQPCKAGRVTLLGGALGIASTQPRCVSFVTFFCCRNPMPGSPKSCFHRVGHPWKQHRDDRGAGLGMMGPRCQGIRNVAEGICEPVQRQPCRTAGPVRYAPPAIAARPAAQRRLMSCVIAAACAIGCSHGPVPGGSSLPVCVQRPQPDCH